MLLSWVKGGISAHSPTPTQYDISYPLRVHEMSYWVGVGEQSEIKRSKEGGLGWWLRGREVVALGGPRKVREWVALGDGDGGDVVRIGDGLLHAAMRGAEDGIREPENRSGVVTKHGGPQSFVAPDPAARSGRCTR